MRGLLITLAVIAITWNVAYYVYHDCPEATEPNPYYQLPYDALWCPPGSYLGGRDCIYDYEEGR